MNDENLIPFTERSESEVREMNRRGGVRSGQTRRRKKAVSDLVRDMMDRPLTEEQREELLEKNPYLEDEDAVYAAAMVSTQMQFALRSRVMDEDGNRVYVCTPRESIAAFAALAEMDAEAMGRDEQRSDVWRMDPMDLTVDMVAPYRAIHQFYDGELDLGDVVLKGGRGGAKSSFAAQIALEVMEQDPNANVVYGRRYAVDLRHTVYASFVRLLNEKGMAGEWDLTTSPMRATRRETGTAVYFFGMDKAEELKSFVPEVGYVKLLLFEEADEMMGDEQMDSAADTFLRANGHEGARQLRMKVFNPPASRNNFMNEWCAAHVGDPASRIFDFSYLNVPPEWLGEAFLDRAARAKAERPEWYRNNYLGEVTGEGGELFANVTERRLADDEVWELLGRSWQGLDFGYEHPMAYVRVAYDPERDEVVALAEHVERHARLDAFMDGVRSLDVAGPGGSRYEAMRNEVICDSAEPDRIRELLDMGWDAVASVKRWKGGGRAYAWDWLRTRRSIVVDPSRTPNLAHELRTLEFERVRGGFSSRYPDLGEDCVMATIYALNRVIRNAGDGY